MNNKIEIPGKNNFENDTVNNLSDKVKDTLHSKEGSDMFKKEDIEDFKQNIDSLVKKIKSATEDELPELKKSLLKVLNSDGTSPLFSDQPIKNTAKTLKNYAKKEIDEVCNTGDAYIADHPWKAVTIAGVVGLCIGAAIIR
ncbi:MAG: hypothetical protein V4525_16710 [Pseudomonadota bacterium]